MANRILRGKQHTHILLGMYFGFLVVLFVVRLLLTWEANANFLFTLIFAWLGFMLHQGFGWARWAVVALLLLLLAVFSFVFVKMAAWLPWTAPVMSGYLLFWGLYFAVLIVGFAAWPPVAAYLRQRRLKEDVA